MTAEFGNFSYASRLWAILTSPLTNNLQNKRMRIIINKIKINHEV
jgi:hypothetical protein